MKKFLNGRPIQELDPIERYFTMNNIIKQEYIDYLQLTMPLFSQADSKLKNDIFKSINDIFFGEDETPKEKGKKTVSVLKQLEENIKKIRTHGAKEILNEQQAMDTLANAKQNVTKIL